MRKLAQKHDRGFEPLADVVETTYRAMVSAFIATEQNYFKHLIPMGDAT